MLFATRLRFFMYFRTLKQEAEEDGGEEQHNHSRRTCK